MSGTRWCDNCGWWVVGEHGPDVCGEFKKSAGVRSAQGGDMSDSGRAVRYKCIFCEEWVTEEHEQWMCSTARDARLNELLMTKPAEPEKVDHPAHYGGDTPYEAIKVIEAWGLGFSLGNCVKYISRAGKKESENELRDLSKARWYLDRYIKKLEAGQ